MPGGNPDFETQQFVGGKAAMQLNGPWSLIDTKGKVKFQLGIAPIPAGADGSKITAGSGFGISRSCKTPDAAFQAIMSMTSEKPLTTLAAAGRAYPARIAAPRPGSPRRVR